MTRAAARRDRPPDPGNEKRRPRQEAANLENLGNFSYTKDNSSLINSQARWLLRRYFIPLRVGLVVAPLAFGGGQ
jgi:hypothetical protein